MIRRIDVTIKGTHPLLMHGTASMDPTNPLKKRSSEITAKGKKKTESDLAELDWLDFQLALYHNGEHVFVPDTWILGTICGGAKAKRQGKEALAALEIEELEIPLQYDGPSDPKALYDAKFTDRRRVVIQRQGILKTRPRFNKWLLRFLLLIDESLINISAVKSALEHAGMRIGIGDFRPRFGRFEVAKWKEI